MKRRKFLSNIPTVSAGLALSNIPIICVKARSSASVAKEEHATAIIVGGGLGGCAAALAACRNGLDVILTEETDWLGGQLSQQGVPPDEHQWIETHGAPRSYRELRNAIRDHYRTNFRLSDGAKIKSYLNPGNGMVSRLCHEPSVAASVISKMLQPYVTKGSLKILYRHKITHADIDGDDVKSIGLTDLNTGQSRTLQGKYFVDATELGDLLPLTRTEHVSGTESKQETRELHAPEVANPRNHQAFTLCFALDYYPEEDHTIAQPKSYKYWRNYVPKMSPPWAGKLLELNYSNPKTLEPKRLGFNPTGAPTGTWLNLWNYRRIIDRSNFATGSFKSDTTIVNWPQNDFFPGNLIDVDDVQFQKVVGEATELNLSLLYWLQTEAPRPDDGLGWPGLKLNKEVMGTENGMAKYPYVRESRRIKSEFTILEEHVGAENRVLVAGPSKGKKSAAFLTVLALATTTLICTQVVQEIITLIFLLCHFKFP